MRSEHIHNRVAFQLLFLVSLLLILSCQESDSEQPCTECNVTWILDGTQYEAIGLVLNMTSSNSYMSINGVSPNSSAREVHFFICNPEIGTFSLVKKDPSGCKNITARQGFATYTSGPSLSESSKYITDDSHTGTLEITQLDQNTISGNFTCTFVETGADGTPLSGGEEITITGEFNISL